jgi:uncharacterized RmlC-like cupin family protein
MEIHALCSQREPFDWQAALGFPPQLEQTALNPNLMAVRSAHAYLKGTVFKLIRDAMNSPATIHIVSPQDFDSGTAQTPRSERLAAIAPSLGIPSTIWGGMFEVEPGSRTGVHHHGEQETIAYVLSGVCEIRWGATGEFVARAKAGDFIHVPAFLLHMEINPSKLEPFRWIVVRSTATPIVVNLPDDTWP